MANKRIRVAASDSGPWYTLPGNQGERSAELAGVDDTIFGQGYESNNPNLGQWMITANGLFKGVAGYNVVLKKTGTSTAMTDEAMSLVSGKTYRITNAAHRVIDPEVAVVVEDGGTPVDAEDILNIDYVGGTVTFVGGYTVGGSVTIATGNYLPTGAFGCSRSFTLTQSTAEIDSTCYEFAQANEGMRRFEGGLKTVSLEVGGIYQAATDWYEIMKARNPLTIEIDLDASNTGKTVARGIFRVSSEGQSGNQGNVEESTQQFTLYVPDGDLVLQPFGWYFNTTPLNAGIKLVLDSWQNSTTIFVQYLPDGEDGYTGEAIVTEASLANQIEGQNEFTFSFRGIGDLEVVV